MRGYVLEARHKDSADAEYRPVIFACSRDEAVEWAGANLDPQHVEHRVLPGIATPKSTVCNELEIARAH